MSGPIVIAVDGPGGVGKTSVSRGVADRLGFSHLDTGAYYRAATIVALINRVDLNDGREVADVVGAAGFDFEDGVMRLEGIDMSGPIRSDMVTKNVSVVSAHPEVRAVLVEHQRDWVTSIRRPAVVEGRDIGTVVFADSPLKIYLTAAPEVRAYRRARQVGAPTSEEVQREMATRDQTDSTRSASPLMVASDAVELDTSELTLESVIGEIVRLAEQRGIGSSAS